MNDVKFLDLHGERVAYRDEGSGEVLLLIHGMAGSSDAWRELIPRLSKHYRVVAPDMLGHGQTAKPRGDYSSAHSPCRCAISSTSWGSLRRRSSAIPSAAEWRCSSCISIPTTANASS